MLGSLIKRIDEWKITTLIEVNMRRPKILLVVGAILLVIPWMSACRKTPDTSNATSESASAVPVASQACTDWSSQWQQSDYGASTLWQVEEWRVLSPAETLAFAEPIFEQSDDNIKVVFAHWTGEPKLQSEIPESQRYFVDIGKIVQLPDITGNGHCDYAVEIQPIRTDVSRQDRRITCSDVLSRLCVFHPTPHGSMMSGQGLFFYRLMTMPLLYEGTEEGPQLVGEIGSFVDQASRNIISSHRWTGRLRETDGDDFLFVVEPKNRSAQYEIAYESFGALPDTIRNVYNRETRDIMRPIYFRFDSLIHTDDHIVLDGLDPWQHVDEEVFILNLALKMDKDRNTFFEDIEFEGYGPVQSDQRPDLTLPPEYQDLDIRIGDQLVAYNGTPITEMMETFKDQLSDLDDSEHWSHSPFERQLLGGLFERFWHDLEGQREETACAGGSCETYGENIRSEAVELLLRRPDGTEYDVSIIPPSLLERGGVVEEDKH